MHKPTKEAFKKTLDSYTVSETSKQVLRRVPFTVLTAIAASGRNTIIRELVKTGKYYFVVSDTTRPHRENDGILEQNGVDYWFRTEEDMLSDLQAGKFIEAALIHDQQVSGTSIRELEKAGQKHLIAIGDIEPQGVELVVNTSPSFTPIFVLPPSYDEWMTRWQKRGLIDDAERKRRMMSAQKELALALDTDYYHFLVNDDLSKAVKGVEKIMNGDIDPAHEENGRKVAMTILQKLSCVL